MFSTELKVFFLRVDGLEFPIFLEDDVPLKDTILSAVSCLARATRLLV